MLLAIQIIGNLSMLIFAIAIITAKFIPNPDKFINFIKRHKAVNYSFMILSLTGCVYFIYSVFRMF